jgi:methyl-accepting chemotaxis protein
MIQRVLSSLRNRILLGGLTTILLIGIVWLICGSYYLQRYEESVDNGRIISNVHGDMHEAFLLESNALLYDAKREDFFRTGKTPLLQKRDEVLKNVFDNLKKFEQTSDDTGRQAIQALRQATERHEADFHTLTEDLRKQGASQWGQEGLWRTSIHKVEGVVARSGNLRLQNLLLQLRLDEKEYLLNRNEETFSTVSNSLALFRASFRSLPQGAALAGSLQTYERSLQQHRHLQASTGFGAESGLAKAQRNSVEVMDPLLESLDSRTSEAGKRARKSLFWANIIILALGIGLGGLAFSLFAKSLAAPVIALKDAAIAIGAGNLDRRVEVHSTDEIGVLSHSFNGMGENLKNINQQLREASGTLAASASEILASTTQVAAGASETAAAVTQTTATVEEVKQTAQLSSQKAREVADSALHSAEVSFTGNQSVMESIAGMERVREQMASIAESVINLSEQSQAIGDIINTVNDLAEQSNLLAVNAAIEAAKAGEQGKGFGVVAQEVKSLAEQSKQATRQVRTILNEIQKATGAAVMSTEQGTKAVEAGLSQAEEAGRSIQNLSSSIEDAAQAALQIAASSQEQLVGVDQVALAMNSIKDASTQNVTSMRQLEIAARDLAAVGQSLRKLVETSNAELTNHK